jgi:hypothetical protein
MVLLFVAFLIFAELLEIFFNSSTLEISFQSGPSEMGPAGRVSARILRWKFNGSIQIIQWTRPCVILDGCNPSPQDLEMEEQHALSLEPSLLSPEDPITKEVDRVLQRILAVCNIKDYQQRKWRLMVVDAPGTFTGSSTTLLLLTTW